MMELPIRFKFRAHSADGRRTDKTYHTQEGFEDENRQTIETVCRMNLNEPFTLSPCAHIGETLVDGKEPFVYSREDDAQDERLSKAIAYALDDLRNPESSLRRNLYAEYSDEGSGDGGLISFGMKLIDSILADGGTGSGGSDISDMTKIVAKIYETYANRYLDYGEYLNYFSFYLKPGMLEEELKSMDPTEGDYMLESGMDDLDKEFVLSNIIPAFYYSLNFLDRVKPRVRSIYDYSFELG